jgi:hypothetical protein
VAKNYDSQILTSLVVNMFDTPPPHKKHKKRKPKAFAGKYNMIVRIMYLFIFIFRLRMTERRGQFMLSCIAVVNTSIKSMSFKIKSGSSTSKFEILPLS